MTTALSRGVYLYDAPGRLCVETRAVLTAMDVPLARAPHEAGLAIAPLLRRRLPRAEWAAPELGTLIFHPSLLPRHRGPDAVRWTCYAGDVITAATWFWCDDGCDTGDICEQEIVPVARGITPRDLYDQLLVPAAVVALRRVVWQLRSGYVRRMEQCESAATYEPAFQRLSASPAGWRAEPSATGTQSGAP